MNLWSHSWIAAAIGLLGLIPLVQAATLQDPTRPTDPAHYFSTPVVRHGNDHWTLKSTLVAADRRIAVINDQQVSEGDRIAGAKIIRIRKTDVLIQTAERTITLQLIPDTLKKRP